MMTFMPSAGQTGRWRHSLLNLSVCLSVSKLVNATRELNWRKLFTGQRSTLGMRRSKVVTWG